MPDPSRIEAARIEATRTALAPPGAWRVGLEAGRGEHEAQQRLLDEIERAVARGASPGEVGALLDDFVEHANAHFLSEQLAMRNHAYEAYEQHVQEHDALMAHARALLVGVWGGRPAEPAQAVAALRNWLLVHMKTTDAAFEEYLERRAGEAEGVAR